MSRIARRSSASSDSATVQRSARPAAGRSSLTDKAYRSRRAGEAPAAQSMDDVATSAVAGKGAGMPLLGEVQSHIESHLGSDLSGVRVHTDDNARAAADTMGARAFTHGSDVFLGSGERPGDMGLMAHELTHVVQQGAAAPRAQAKLTVGGEDTAEEREADEVAARVTGAAPMGAADAMSAVTGGLVQRQQRPDAEPHVGQGPGASTATPTWPRDKVIAMQRQLRRLGLYTLGIDGVLGRGTDAGLVEAFGGFEWRTMTADDVIGRLTAATPTAGTRGEHNLRYGEMFADGLLDMTLGIGFDEARWHMTAQSGMVSALGARGFVANNALGIRLYNEAGRAVPANAFGTFYVKQNALTYRPPAGAARQIHAVVRLVYSADGSQGAETAQAFRDGMVQSDAAFYAGHGRYGSGPDFDRNFTFELLDDTGRVEETIADYEELETVLREEGVRARPARSAWQQFEWREQNGRIRVHGDNAGNLFLNPTNRHTGEFGGRLMYWNLQRRQGGAPVQTGRGNALATQAAAHPERRYRVLVFTGCRTQDYERSI
ncbi:MAG TPA: DUF4157 domain-containing protein, partial [Kofleriaceae bacterium]|nr:DUF4157 domain-containing protein [Kofleriaceae bacterium]